MRPARRAPRRALLFPVTALAALRLTLLWCGIVTGSSASALPAPLVTPSSPPIWTAAGEFDFEDFGYSIAGAGDVNRDGFGDVIIGAPQWGPNESERGRALVYFGSPAGLSPQPAWSLEGTRVYGGLGFPVSSARDVNGDGFADIIVGEAGFDGGHRPFRGRALVVPGSPAGPRTERAWEAAGDSAYEYFGEIAAGAGDVNGDGYDDILIGSSKRTVLFLGRPGGIEREPAWTGPPYWVVTGAGDVNGDGYDDVFMGRYVYVGSRAGLSSEPAWTGPWGRSAAGGGDLNGDGYGDVVVGGVGDFGEWVYVYRGSASGLSPEPAWVIRDPGAFSYAFGISVALAGDVNADGYADLAVATPGLFRFPSVYAYLGGPGGPSAIPDWVAVKPSSPQHQILAALGADVNGDGSSEVLIGWPHDVVGTKSRGRAELYALGPAYPAPNIVHEPVPIAPLGAPVTFEATATDATHSVARVEILYRPVLEPDFRPPVAMEPVGGDLYRGTLTADQVGDFGIVYAIRATDDYGLSAETIPIGMDLALPEGLAFGVRVEPAARGGAGRISFVTRRAGPACVRVFDVQGRLVRTLLDESSLPPGRHSVSVETMPGAAGVLFYRVETQDGAWGGKLVRLK